MTCLLLRPHSTVELVDRAEVGGLVERIRDDADGRLVRVRLTRQGDMLSWPGRGQGIWLSG